MLKKRLLSISILFGILTNINAQVNIITSSTIRVGPDVVHRKFIAPSVPWSIDVLEIDISNPYIGIESVKADDRLYGSERVSSMASRKSYNGHLAVGAINGDFYGGGGVPINAQVINGEFLRSVEYNNKSNLGFDVDNYPMIGVTNFSGKLNTKTGIYNINGVNMTRQTDYLVMFNPYFGNSTGTNQWGTEVLITPISSWIANDTVICIIEQIEKGIGNMLIPENKAVLSGHGLAESFLNNNVQVGDTITLCLNLLPSFPKLNQLIGGFPKIVNQGENYVNQGYNQEGGPGHTYERHPRTAVGFSADSTKLYFVTVDGRQLCSKGMTLIELADFMIDIGITSGINLDGGGSTTIVVRDKVRNSPSDGSERFVANGLLAISSASQDSLFIIQIEPDNLRMFVGESVRFKASGWDQYYNPIDINASEIEFSVDDHLGYIDENGLFTVSFVNDSGWLFVNYNNLLDSAYIHLKSISRMSLSPKICVIDTIQTMNFRVVIVDEDGQGQYLPKDQIQWQSLNPVVGVIDSAGTFKGKTEGITEIVASCYGFSDTASVTVEICEGIVTLDPMDDTAIWSISGLNYDAQTTELSLVDTPRTYGTGSFKVDYQFTRLATERSYIYLNTDIHVSGIPESIEFDFLSDGAKHKAYVIVSDGDDELFRSFISGYAQDTTKFDTLSALTSNLVAIDPTSSLNYPIRIKQIQIRLGTSADVGEINSGTIYFDNLRIVYPSTAIDNPFNGRGIPEDFNLDQNYPNPFNTSTTIPFEIPQDGFLSLKVYDILGNEVAVLINRDILAGKYRIEFNGNNLSSGVYFYRIESGKFIDTKKILLIK